MESEQKYKITIKPFSGGKLIQSYKSNPEFGYLVLESDEPFLCPTIISDVQLLETFDAKSFKFPKRQALLRAKTETLEKFVKASNDKTLPGRIRITEYLEDEIPEDVKKANIRDDIPYEEAIKPYFIVFKPKNDSIENRIRDKFSAKSNDRILTKNGKRILRFFSWQEDYKEDIQIKGFDFDFEPKIPIFTGGDIPVIEPKEEYIEIIQEEDKQENSISQNTETSQASIKRENSVMLPLVAVLVLGAIVALIMLPSLFAAVCVIVGSLIIFYFAGAFYQALFTKPVEFDLLRTIVIGVAVILVIGAIMVINELTKTPNDPDMWRHP
jgi:hypothetical protein